MAIDYNQYIKLRGEYFEKFNKAYTSYMRALGDATSKYSAKLPASSAEYEFAVSRATGEFIKVLGDLKGRYKEVAQQDRIFRGY